MGSANFGHYLWPETLGLTESCYREIAEIIERVAQEVRPKRIDAAHPSPDRAAQARPLGESW